MALALAMAMALSMAMAMALAMAMAMALAMALNNKNSARVICAPHNQSARSHEKASGNHVRFGGLAVPRRPGSGRARAAIAVADYGATRAPAQRRSARVRGRGRD